jgi:hypothetical protein
MELALSDLKITCEASDLSNFMEVLPVRWRRYSAQKFSKLKKPYLLERVKGIEPSFRSRKANTRNC